MRMNHLGLQREATKTAQLLYTWKFYIFSIPKQVWEEEETKLAGQVSWYAQNPLYFLTILLCTSSEKMYDNKKNKQFLLQYQKLNHINSSIQLL